MCIQPFFLKTNLLTKFAVIWVKRRQKAGFLSPRSSKITVTKEKERRKRKGEEKERRRRKKSNGCTISFYNSYFGVFGRQQEYNTIIWRDTTLFDSEDDYCTGCGNVSHCQQQQSYSGLHSPGRSNLSQKKNCWTQEVHLVITLSKIRLDI